MAKINGKADRKVTYYAVGAMIVLAGLGYGAMYVFGGSGAPAAPEARPAPSKTASLGSTAEGGVTYNQTFQERMLKTVNQSMEQMRSENSITMENFRREQAARDAERENRIAQDLAMAREAQQPAGAPTLSAAVEGIKIHNGTGNGANRRADGDDGGFIGSPSDVKDAAGDVQQSTAPSTAKKEKPGPNIPGNGFVKGRTLNGIAATAGGEPELFLVRLEGKYQAANGFVINLDGCVAEVEGRADLPSSRIKGKPAKMTCNFSSGASKTWDVSGYIVDKDGMNGLLGVINDNGGKKLAGATLGGGIALAGARLSAAQTQTYTGVGGSSSAVTGSVGADLAGGLAQGAGNELSRQVIEHYNQYRSTIQVGGIREVTLVLLNDLSVPDAGKEITPTYSATSTKGNQ